jgi:hypothetical protein
MADVCWRLVGMNVQRYANVRTVLEHAEQLKNVGDGTGDDTASTAAVAGVDAEQLQQALVCGSCVRGCMRLR